MARHWLELEFEISCRAWMLKNFQESLPKDPLSQMIDKATGFDKKCRKDALRTLKELVPLFEEYHKATGKDVTKEIEGAKKLIAVLIDPPVGTRASRPKARRGGSTPPGIIRQR